MFTSWLTDGRTDDRTGREVLNIVPRSTCASPELNVNNYIRYWQNYATES